METNARIVSVTSSSTTSAAGVPSAAVEQDKSPPKTSQTGSKAEDATRYRLVIEEGPSLGSFIYKTLDSETGEVVRQFPREQVVRLAEAREYDSGAVIDTVV